MSKLPKTLFRIILCILPFAIAVLLIPSPKRTPLMVVATEPGFQVTSVACTYGTNHLFYSGNPLTRFADPILVPLIGRYVCQIPLATKTPSTVVWVRFKNPGFGVPGNHFTEIRTEFENPSGAVSTLKAGIQMTSSRERDFLLCWALPNNPETHRGSLIRIRYTNGNVAATFRLP